MYRPVTGSPQKKNHLIQSVFFILLVGIAIYVLLQSPFFEIKTFVVNGNRQLNKEDIIQFAGLPKGANIFKVNIGECETRLELVPIIKEIEIKRQLPDKIVINVTERQAVALLPAENSFIKVDVDGVYLQRGQISSALPIITGLNLKLNGPGQRVEGEYLTAALRSLSQLPRPLIMRLSEININKAGQLTLYTIDGTQGRMGLPKEITYKAVVFQQVINSVKQPGSEIEYVDLSNPRVPVVKYFKQQGGGTVKIKEYQWGLVVAGLVLGLMITVQYRSSKEITETPPIARVQALSQEINQKREERLALQKRVNELREKLDDKATVQSEDTREQLETYRILAGIKAVSGPGVEVTLSDSNEALPPGQDPNLYVLHDEDVLRVLNELKAAGAEALALNGVRLIATSEIRCIGPTILTNKNKRLPAPFTITAIGNSQTLENSLYMKGGVVDQLKIWGIQVQVHKKNNLEMAGFTGTTTFEYAKSVEAKGGGQANE